MSADSHPNTAWITGAGGLIGSYLVKAAPANWKARPLHHGDVDLLDFDRVNLLMNVEPPGLIIHCAAMTKNPVCDAHPELAMKVNRDVTVNLAAQAAAQGIRFVFLSTDLVFDGKKGNYKENDAVSPLGIYAKTKAFAEEIVLSNRKQTVVRTSLNAGHSPTGDRAFNEEMRKAFAAGQTLSLFEDEFRCPIPAEVTARAIWEIVGESGIFHLCGAERLSRYEIGRLVAANHPELNPKIVRGSLRDYKGSPRSPDTSMDCSKIQAKLSFPLPKFSDWMRQQPIGTV
jgi:dTDP-4-dehydrorhamnose reductase